MRPIFAVLGARALGALAAQPSSRRDRFRFYLMIVAGKAGWRGRRSTLPDSPDPAPEPEKISPTESRHRVAPAAAGAAQGVADVASETAHVAVS